SRQLALLLVIRYSALVLQLFLSKFLNVPGGPAWIRTHSVRSAISHPFKDLSVNIRRGMNVWTQREGVHATGYQVPSPPDAGHDRVSLRRLAGLLAGRLGPRPPVLPGDGCEGETRIVMSLHESCSASARRLEANGREGAFSLPTLFLERSLTRHQH